jgi:hypothetical protein
MYPPACGVVHVPPEQACPALHPLPQLPQFDVVARLASQPLETVESQLPHPVLQDEIVHW